MADTGQGTPSISVIIPVFNGATDLGRVLQAIRQSTFSPYELIVVDDGSTDGSGTVAGTYADKVIRMERSGGPARARNRGAAEARGPILLFVDADVLLPPDILGRVAEAFTTDAVSAVFGSYNNLPEDRGFFSQYKNLFHHWVHQSGSTAASTFWSGFGAIRKTVFDDAGGFPESYHKPSIEDVALGYRLKRKGINIELVKDLQVTHLKRWTFTSLVTTDIMNRAIPWTRLAWTEGLPRDLNFRHSDRLSGVLACLLPLSLCLVPLWPMAFFLPLSFIIFLILLNHRLYRFFFREKGAVFTSASVLFHWFYLVYSSLTFAVMSALCFVQYRDLKDGAGSGMR